MEQPSPTITPNTSSPTPDPKALLDAANSASEKVAALHIAFLALCAYVLVIVFSTTDMDLLIGKGIKLPVVDVEVPIVGFYAVVPYLLVLFHFNLLLQLQLLSHKLYAFDDAAAKGESASGLYDQLNIFPFNYYLVGRPSPLVKGFLATVVTISVLVLPLVALLTLQARFLAYQNVAVTWAQRAATWLDVALVAILWPLIMDCRDSWRAYVRVIWEHAGLHRLRWLWGFTGFAMAVSWLCMDLGNTWVLVFYALTAWLLLPLVTTAARRGVRWLSHDRYFALSQAAPPILLGFPGLLTIVLLGLPLPLLLHVDGERLATPGAYSTLILDPLRHLDLHEKVLLAKPARPEIIADLHGTGPAKREVALRSIERIDLQRRGLRGANLYKTIMPMADLREANLQGANLWEADLGGADLRETQLQRTILFGTQLQGAKLWGAQLQGADLREAQLQGANLQGAQLQGAILWRAQLQGANFLETQLQGANLAMAKLQGADLPLVQLQGANLLKATLYTELIKSADIELVDARGLEWQPLSAEELKQVQEVLPFRPQLTERQLQQATVAGLTPPLITSCLRDQDTRVPCKKDLSLDQFRESLLPELEKLACQSPDIARGILQRYEDPLFSHPLFPFAAKGLALRLKNRLQTGASNESCPGLTLLSGADKEYLKRLVQRDEAQQSAPSSVPSPTDVAPTR